ncbi:NTP transferase domain-containing protein [Halomarina pelagica]|uniref:NTP transferase domain-containing protein n=1 Tax=Halomarina pelagica TaxID=2961599 RepID=UPI0020C2B693|nr:NTP transferase domain-containing protein [Halomarina sp. BND7]
MCGGRGTRLDRGEKPLVEVCGEPMVARVAAACAASRVEATYAVTSPHAPQTVRVARERLDLPSIGTPGEGYVADLDRALADPRVEPPVLTVVADLPLLDGPTLDAVLDAAAERGSLAVCVPASLKRALGASVDTAFEHEGRELAPTGCNVVADDPDSIMITENDRLAVNVNRPRDVRIAEERCD